MSCSRLRKEPCAENATCSWITGKGCKSNAIIKALYKIDENAAIKALKSRVNNKSKLQSQQFKKRLAIFSENLAILNKLRSTLPKRFNDQTMRSINYLKDESVITLHPHILQKYIETITYHIQKGPKNPPAQLVQYTMSNIAKKGKKCTKAQVKDALLQSYRSYTSTDNLPDLHNDAFNALFNKWDGWTDTDPQEHVYEYLCDSM